MVVDNEIKELFSSVVESYETLSLRMEALENSIHALLEQKKKQNNVFLNFSEDIKKALEKQTAISNEIKENLKENKKKRILVDCSQISLNKTI